MLNPYCIPSRKDLTDTEKAIYLKLVELAKAGKIEWDTRDAGCFGKYRIEMYDTNVIVSVVDDAIKNIRHFASFDIRGTQIAGDLAAIASEQYDAFKAQLTAEFLQA